MTYLRLKKQMPSGTFNNFLENIYAPAAFLSGTRASNEEGLSSVRVNIKELSDKYELNLIAPGFAKEDFEIKLEKDLLTIETKSRTEESGEDIKYVRKEYKVDGFKRSFHVNETIDTDGIAAEYVAGILVVTLAKKAPVAPLVKSISIQ